MRIACSIHLRNKHTPVVVGDTCRSVNTHGAASCCCASRVLSSTRATRFRFSIKRQLDLHCGRDWRPAFVPFSFTFVHAGGSQECLFRERRPQQLQANWQVLAAETGGE